MHEITYSDCGQDNLEIIAPLRLKLRAQHSELSEHFGSDFDPSKADTTLAGFIATAAEGAMRIFTASAGAECVAYCLVIVDRDSKGEIASLFVDGPYRGRRIGETLMRSALDWLDSHGASPISLHVLPENRRAIKFYERLGFRPRTLVMRRLGADRPQ